MEIWKDIAGYEGKYQVNNYGYVRNASTFQYITPVDNGSGYLSVGLYQGNRKKRWYVHRLVAIAFIPSREGAGEVNHIDGNKYNNCCTNLEWVTSSENKIHAMQIGKLRSFGHKAKPIVATHIESGKVTLFSSISEARKKIGSEHIPAVLIGKRSQCKGYTFQFAEEVMPDAVIDNTCTK